jgi:hypothetical protein
MDIPDYPLRHNYDVPLAVSIHEKDVKVYRHTVPLDEDLSDSQNLDKFTTLVASYDNVNEIFLGISGDDKYYPSLSGICNTILLNTSDNNYVFIDRDGFSFKAIEKIIEYKSPYGANEVPYPFAITENYVYMILDKMYIEKHYFNTSDDWEDLYHAFYERKLKKFATYIDKRKKNKITDYEDMYHTNIFLIIKPGEFGSYNDIIKLFEPHTKYGTFEGCDMSTDSEEFEITFEIKQSKIHLFEKKIQRIVESNDFIFSYNMHYYPDE